MTRFVPWTCALLLTLAPATLADDEPDPDFRAWGKLTQVKKTDYFTLSYKALDGRKARSAKAYLQIAEDAALYRDRRILLTALKKGDELWVFARKQEESGQTPEGRGYVDRQLTNTQLVVAGEGVVVQQEAKPKKDSPLPTWHQVTVSRPGTSLTVSLEGDEYRLVCAKSFVALRRERLDKTPRLNKKLTEVSGSTHDARPDGGKDLPSFLIKRLVVLEARARGVYPLLIAPPRVSE